MEVQMKYFTTFLLVLFLLLNVSDAQFKYENPVWIKNNTGTALTSVQVMIKFNTAVPITSGWMLANGNDIRFTSACNSTTFLGHWIEGYLNTDSTKIWINVPSIGANDSTQIFLYYGNPAATNTSTISIFYGPHSATDSVVVSSTNTVSNCQRGFKFTANEDLLVAYFGKRIPNATQRYLTLFDFTTQAILAQIQVDAGTAGVYNYNTLTTPLWLRSGQQYLMELFNSSGDMYYYGVSTQIGQHLTFLNMQYCNNCTQNTFPTTVLIGYHYGCPDFLYYSKQNVSPAPTHRILPAADSVTPAVPTGLSATPSGNGAALLKCNKNSEFDIYQYAFYKNTTNSPSTSTLVGYANHPDTSLTATGLTAGTWYFWVRARDRYCDNRTSAYSTSVSCVVVTGIGQIGNIIPDNFYMNQNYPNPFNPLTQINFGLKKDEFVEMKIFDVTGKEIMTLINSKMNAGNHIVEFDGSNFASGIYFYRINAGTFTDIKKMVLIK